ncbi:MAG: hypothetical protein COB71_09270 [Thiotrichales bacterium]|nr:MAG: hypothetical protein COB71_09270 [Thiotrichales bacterium]
MSDDLDIDESLREMAAGEELSSAEKDFERTVRPDNFKEFVGQEKMVGMWVIWSLIIKHGFLLIILK